MRRAILIVEDNPVVQSLLRTFSELLDCRYDITDNGVEAFEAAARNSYDMILMDCYIPRMDGFETTRKIRGEENKNRDTPIVAITGQTKTDNSEIFLSAGMNDFLFKPFDLHDLRDVLDRWTIGGRKIQTIVPATKTEDSLVVLDIPRAMKISGGTPGGLKELFDDYLRGVAEDLAHLESATENDLRDKIMYHAHNSAGASAFCGANELSAILYSMEKAGEDGNFEFAALLLEHARDGFSRLKAEINVLTRAKE